MIHNMRENKEKTIKKGNKFVLLLIISGFVISVLCMSVYGNLFQNQKNLAFIRLFFNQNNSLNLNKKTFPIYLYLPLPSSQNININIKFMNFVYDQQSDFSENNFKVTGYLVNEIVISDINNHANFSSAKRIDAKYYISETTAFFNFDSSKDNILYIMINKSEKNFNNYESFRIDVFCNEENAEIKIM